MGKVIELPAVRPPRRPKGDIDCQVRQEDLAELLGAFRASLVAVEPEKAAASERARNWLGDAKKYLSNYRVYVQEPTPER